MKGFLKCFYGYRNLGDEMLFWGVIDYINQHYPDVTHLTVEVQDRHWMEKWYTENRGKGDGLLRSSQGQLGGGFVDGAKTIEFVELSRNIRDNFVYDIYFFGGGEVFAESRGFHGGWNYLLRYFFAINSKPFVLLGGIETPIGVRQQILYKYLLPKAKEIICRDETSYRTARRYNHHVVKWHDFAEELKEVAEGNKRYQKATEGKEYILVNMIASMAKEENFALIQQFVAQYPEHDIIYVPCAEVDKEYGKRIVGMYPEATIYDWTEHRLIDILMLFAQAKAGIGCRLHFLLLLQMFGVDRYAMVYAEKVKKLIQSTIHLSVKS